MSEAQAALQKGLCDPDSLQAVHSCISMAGEEARQVLTSGRGLGHRPPQTLQAWIGAWSRLGHGHHGAPTGKGGQPQAGQHVIHP